MKKISKRITTIHSIVDIKKQYGIDDAISMLKKTSTVKFVESLDVAINLGIDSKKTDQGVKGFSILPNGTGKNTKIAVFASGEEAKLAKNSGADIVGEYDLIEKIKNGYICFDVLISSPDSMNIISQLGKILGPRGLMPNPKMGTVTKNIPEVIKNIKSGQVFYRNDKYGIIHSSVGRINMESKKLKENLEFLISSIRRSKPTQFKGTFFKKIVLSTTMGIGLTIEKSSLSIIGI